MKVYFGVVENRSDPLELGRCQVRVVGLHTHDKSLLPTSDLPWCASLQPTTSAAMNGIGHAPLGPVEGTSVVVTYLDDSMQQGLIMGAVGGIATEPLPIDFDDSGPILPSSRIDLVKLRTIPGPVTGNKLTFYDPDSARTDLTSPLKANMKVIGYQLPENTTIISIDSGTTITISNTVRDYTENIIQFENAPSNLSALAESKSTVIGSTTAEKADEVKQTSTNQTIPTIPPPKSVTNVAQASEGIKALIAACDKVGLTTKEQKCALLGISGGECGWIPKLEAYNYNPAQLKKVYSFATEEDVEKYANAPKKGITRKEFFSWAYGTTKRGKGFIGNRNDEDGGIYHGRGFIQLTGRGNYVKYQKLATQMGLSVNIVDDPDSLDNDINTSAIIAALFVKNETPKGINPNAHPGYFFAAKSAVGVNIPEIAARKESYYNYFYGAEASGGIIKDAGAVSPGEPVITGTDRPGPSDKAIQSGSYGVGFRDPNNKYPLKDYLGESDINRLARGVVEGTVVGLKDAKRVYGIPKAIDSGFWEQPQPVYGAKYPFNKVFESESGHIQEFDDTPGQERIHTYHRAGTFTEIDANGTQVNYIVGDNYILMEQNGCIHVAGECNITVDGNCNIFARSDANLEVAQNANIRVGNNADIGVATDLTLAVGGDMKVKVAGSYSIDATSVNIKSQEEMSIQAISQLSLKGNATNIEAESDLNILAGGTARMDYAEGQFGNGADGAFDVDNVELTPPPAGIALNPVVPYSIPPERQIEEKATIETPDDWDTPEGRAVAAETNRKDAVVGAAPPVADESAPAATGGVSGTTVDKTLIISAKDYTNDYRLSKNFSLGMLIAGGVNGKHRLTAQMLRYGGSTDRLFTVEEIVGHLAETAHNVLEPALAVLPGGIGGWKTQWEITSGYRLKGVITSESATSDHCKGHCVDIILKHPDLYTKTYETIQQIERVVAYDQIILEYRYPGSCWMHIGYRPSNNRKWAFTMVNDSTYKRNANGIPAGFYLLSTIPAPAKK